MSKRAFNFCAGPAALPEAVLQRAQAELLDWHGKGLSVMEMSHRSDDYTAIAEKAEQDLRDLLAIPSNYKVLFLQGGQPAVRGDSAEPAARGWRGRLCRYRHLVAQGDRGGPSFRARERRGDCQALRLLRDSRTERLAADDGAAYLHYASNETIGGLQFDWVPELGDTPLVVDMSSDILSRPIDVSKFGLICRGAEEHRPVRAGGGHRP